MKLRMWPIILSLLSANLGVAAETIHLNDGTALRGEIVQFQGGKYEIRTQTLGRLSIDEYDIASIEYNDQNHSSSIGKLHSERSQQREAKQESVASPAAGDIQRLQLDIAGNGELMRSISSLQTDPQIQAILQDQEIMQAILRYDLATLQSNPKFMRLMNNPSIKAITKQVGGQ